MGLFCSTSLRPVANASRPPVVYRRYPTLALRDCQPTTGQGIVDGRPARFAGTICYDAHRRAYVIRGSERFIGYLP